MSLQLPCPIVLARYLDSADFILIVSERDVQIGLAFEGSTLESKILVDDWEVEKITTAAYFFEKGSKKHILALATYNKKTQNSRIIYLDNILVDDDTAVLFCESSTPFSSMVFNDMRKELVVADQNGMISLWDIDRNRCKIEFESDPCGVNMVAFNRQSDIVVLGKSVSNQIMVFSLVSNSPQQGPQKTTYTMTKRTEEYTSVCYDFYRNRIVCGSSAGFISVWDVEKNCAFHFNTCLSGPISCIIGDISKHDIFYCTSLNGSVMKVNLYDIESNPSFRDDISPLNHRKIRGIIDSFSSNCKVLDCDEYCKIVEQINNGGFTTCDTLKVNREVSILVGSSSGALKRIVLSNNNDL